MKDARIKVRGSMRPDCHMLMERCVEDGVNYGVEHFYNKHTTLKRPKDTQVAVLKQQVFEAVRNELCHWFQFDGVGCGGG